MDNDRRRKVKRECREAEAVSRASRENKARTYIDDDGCEVTAFPSGHVFYNAGDWY